MPPYIPQDTEAEGNLLATILESDLTDDPLKFVMFAYPWGEEGTPLAEQTGPRKWQRQELESIRDFLRANKEAHAAGKPMSVYRRAIVSGRGPGKSTLLAWLIHWMMSTCPGGTSIVTANTKDQLKQKMWAEMNKWVGMALNAHWFELTTEKMTPATWLADYFKATRKLDSAYYYASAVPWSEENPDAFAGLHNAFGVMILFDEASGIPQPIWGVTEGFFTDPTVRRLWLAFSNPRRPDGPFAELFQDGSGWSTRCIDSREVEGLDYAVLEGIIRKHGADSYEARVEVYGRFPDQGDSGFIAQTLAQEAASHVLPSVGRESPLIMSVDVARFGEDKSVIFYRRGRDARSIPYKMYHKLDTLQLAQEVADCARQHSPDVIVIDDTGVGGGVFDNLKAWRYPVYGFTSSASPRDGDRYVNLRSETWDAARDWLVNGGCIPNDKTLFDQLVTIRYRYRGGKKVMESKDELRGRGLPSPDVADAFVMSFAIPMALVSRRRGHGRPQVADGMDYNVFGEI